MSPLATYAARAFYHSTVLEDMFPAEFMERTWGVVMGTDDGTLVFSAWQRHFCTGSLFAAAAAGRPSPYVCADAVAAALSAGQLPALFERAARGWCALSRGAHPPIARLLERGFAGIPYDGDTQRKHTWRTWVAQDADVQRDVVADVERQALRLRHRLG